MIGVFVIWMNIKMVLNDLFLPTIGWFGWWFVNESVLCRVVSMASISFNIVCSPLLLRLWRRFFSRFICANIYQLYCALLRLCMSLCFLSLIWFNEIIPSRCELQSEVYLCQSSHSLLQHQIYIPCILSYLLLHWPNLSN